MSLPETPTGWMAFAFYTIGAGGGWFVLVVLSIDIVRGYRKAAREKATLTEPRSKPE